MGICWEFGFHVLGEFGLFRNTQPSWRYLRMTDDWVTVFGSNSLDVCAKSDHRLLHARVTYLKIACPLTISCDNQWLKAVNGYGPALIKVSVGDWVTVVDSNSLVLANSEKWPSFVTCTLYLPKNRRSFDDKLQRSIAECCTQAERWLRIFNEERTFSLSLKMALVYR